MVSKDLIVRFDYTVLDKEDKGKLLYLAGEIKKASTQHKTSGIAVGESIAKAHAILAADGKDGQFSAWVEAECGFGRTTAYKYMWTWERFGDCKVLDRFDLSAMQTLSAPSVPDEAREEAIELAAKGHHITNDRSKEIVGQFRPKTAPTPKITEVVVHNVNNSNAQPASVTGSSKPSDNSAAPPESLPTEGTVNQAEPGEQGAGGAGDCLRGGECEFVDGACSKCLEPEQGPPTIPGGPSFPVDKIEAKQAHDESVKEMFATLKEHIRQTTLLLDKINNATGRKFGQVNQTCHETLEIVSIEVHKWAKACK